MTREELITELQRWGMAQTYLTERREEVRENPRQHIIERTRRFAPKTRKLFNKKLVGRDGKDRRRIMAKSACIRGVPVLPMWAADPIRCSSTRKGQWAKPQDVDLAMPPELAWLDVAVTALGRQSPLLELIVRTEYTWDGNRMQRAQAAQRLYRGNLTLWQYRQQLDRALGILQVVADAVKAGYLNRVAAPA